MRILTALATLLLVAPPVEGQGASLAALMPVPAQLALTATRLSLTASFSIAVPRFHDGRLDRAISRVVRRLQMRLGIPLPTVTSQDTSAALIIGVTAAGPTIPDLNQDESYSLTVDAHHAMLAAPTVVGAIRGLETLLQLQQSDSAGLYFQGAEIHDAPRFRWRGLLLDVSRHFEPIEVVKRTLDGMAMVKLNVLHWHLSDDQGFRVESRRLPRLQQFGSDSMYYTQDQIRDIVAYAADRGIRVMPEFDVPGHSSAWFVGYPQLTVGGGPFAIARTWGTFAPTMDPTRASIYTTLDMFIGEMVTLFPDRYWHVGGDEVDPEQWHETPAIQRYMRLHHLADEVALHTAFNRRLFAIVGKHGRIPVGWDEIFQSGLPTSAVIQSWRNSTALANAAAKGYRGVLSAPYYIDHMKTAAEFYAADPLPANTTLSLAQQQLVLGGEACMWGEYVTPEMIDSRLWPRLAAIAERFWSPASVIDVDDMYRRLDVTSHRLEELGIRHEEHIAHMVRYFAGDSTSLFAELLGYVRPRDFGGNGPNQFYPHTALVDAALPDPRPGRELVPLARRAVAGDTAALTDLRQRFVLMDGFAGRLAAVEGAIPAAVNAGQVARLLGNIGRAGMLAANRLDPRLSSIPEWRQQVDSLLAAAVPMRDALRPVGGEAVRILIQGTSH